LRNYKIESWEEKSQTVQVEEAVMDHKAKDKAVKEEDLETKSPKVIMRAARRLWR
jgi:hypothetical protein